MNDIDIHSLEHSRLGIMEFLDKHDIDYITLFEDKRNPRKGIATHRIYSEESQLLFKLKFNDYKGFVDALIAEENEGLHD